MLGAGVLTLIDGDGCGALTMPGVGLCIGRLWLGEYKDLEI